MPLSTGPRPPSPFPFIISFKVQVPSVSPWPLDKVMRAWRGVVAKQCVCEDWRHCSKQHKCRLAFSERAYKWKKKKKDHPATSSLWPLSLGFTRPVFYLFASILFHEEFCWFSPTYNLAPLGSVSVCGPVSSDQNSCSSLGTEEWMEGKWWEETVVISRMFVLSLAFLPLL